MVIASESTEAPIAFDPLLEGPARTGSLAEQARSSYALAREALAEGRFADAAALGRHTIDQAREAYELYLDWIEQIRDYLKAEGVAEAAIERGEAFPADFRAMQATYRVIDLVTASVRAQSLPEAVHG